MIASLSGIVAHKNSGQLVVDVNGVGYLVSVASQLESNLVIGESISLRTSFIVREDSFTIYGFENVAEAQLFDTLRSVNGVGPKLAMLILSQLGIESISAAVVNQDDKVFSSVSGIGPKTAKLLTVTLEGKVLNVSPVSGVSAGNSVLAALIGLGWVDRQAREALKAATLQNPGFTEDKDLLRAALTLLSNDRSQSIEAE